MSSAEALKAARATGVKLWIEGDGLVLEAATAPPSNVLDLLTRHKAGIMALLRPANDGWSGEDWLAFIDERTGTVLCRLYPQDKTQNASGLRRSLAPISPEPTGVTPAAGIAPLLARLIDQQASTGLPPPYLPKNDGDDT